MAAPFRIHVGQYSAAAAWAIVGRLVAAKSAAGFASQYLKQIDAWQDELQLLEHLCQELLLQCPRSRMWSILLEYPIPRRNKYPDVILLADDVIFVIELKVGAARFDSAAQWQAADYALDLREFHVESDSRPIFPILVATQAPMGAVASLPDVSVASPLFRPVSCMAPGQLASLIVTAFGVSHQPDRLPIDAQAWDDSPYRPSS